MQNEQSVEIDRPIAEVFKFTMNNTVKWVDIVVEDEVVEDKNNGDVGTRFHVVTVEKGRRMEFDGEVTRHEPPNVSAVLLKGQYFDLNLEYTFEDVSGRTRVTQVSSAKGKGFTKLMLFLLGWMMKSAGRKSLERSHSLLTKLDGIGIITQREKGVGKWDWLQSSANDFPLKNKCIRCFGACHENTSPKLMVRADTQSRPLCGV